MIKARDRFHLEKLIEELIEEFGPECDLSDIDVSGIADMSWLFYNSQFNGDISNWNVSNVINMSYMFENSQFNGGISNWNISNLESGKKHIQEYINASLDKKALESRVMEEAGEIEVRMM